MILDLDTQYDLLGLGPDMLFHGTRYMNAILAADELALPRVGNPGIYLASDPQVAVYWANISPRPFDEGRGGILALDGGKLRTDFLLLSEPDPQHFQYQSEVVTRPILDLHAYIVGTFWLDELVPGAGLDAPLIEKGEPYPPAVSLASVVRQIRDLPLQGKTLDEVAFDAHYWDVIRQVEIWAGIR